MEKKRFSTFTHLDKPHLFLGRPVSEVVLFGGPFFTGIIFGNFWVLTASGLAAHYAKRKISRELPKHFFAGALYWLLPPIFSQLFPSHKRFLLR